VRHLQTLIPEAFTHVVMQPKISLESASLLTSSELVLSSSPLRSLRAIVLDPDRAPRTSHRLPWQHRSHLQSPWHHRPRAIPEPRTPSSSSSPRHYRPRAVLELANSSTTCCLQARNMSHPKISNFRMWLKFTKF
jgi:hypothetical protein